MSNQKKTKKQKKTYDDNQISNCFPNNTSTITRRDTIKDVINTEPRGIPETQPEVSNVPLCHSQRIWKPVEKLNL
jgi:hypothetical protein